MRLLTITASLVWLSPSAMGWPADFSSVGPLLAEYCSECHGAKEQKSRLRFDEISDDVDSDVKILQRKPGRVDRQRIDQFLDSSREVKKRRARQRRQNCPNPARGHPPPAGNANRSQKEYPVSGGQP